MAIITSVRVIPRSAQHVYESAKDVKRFVTVLPDVDSVDILEEHGNGTVVTKWDATMEVGPMKRRISWTERDHWKDDELLCDFELVEGDMKRFDGTWDFQENGEDSCKVVLNVDFELGVPVLGAMVNKIVNELMQKNLDEMLSGLEKMATS